jgi:UDP-glucose 4-epimerase
MAGSFIGSHVATLLLACGYEAILVAGLLNGKRENVPQGARFYELDFGSGCAEVFEEYNPMSCATRRP